MQVDTIADAAGFDALESRWDAVLSASNQDNPFLRYHWQRTWWDVFGGEDSDGSKRLRILTCHDGDDLVGVLPAFVARTGRMVPARAARLLADEAVGSVGLGAFARAEAEGDVMARLLEGLFAKQTGWDVLDLRFIDPGQAFYRALTAAPFAGAADSRLSDRCDTCPRTALAADWDEYLGGLSKHMRHEVRRSMRRVRERGLEPELITSADALPDAVDDYHRLHEDRMREKFGGQYEVSEPSREFTRRAMADLLSDGALRLWFLAKDGRRLAVLYQFRHGDTLFAMQSGFAAEARQDAQRALWAHAIKHGIDEGCTALDMLLGDQHYKHEWGADDATGLSRIRIYSRTPRGMARNGRDAAADWLAQRKERSGAVATEATS